MVIESLQKLTRARLLAASGEARELRVRGRLSLGEVAEACGVDQSTVWRWETGMRVPRGEAALAYDDVLLSLAKED